MIEVLFFGSVADIVRERKLTIDRAQAGDTLLAVRDHFFDEAIQAGRVSGPAIRMSVNQAITRADQRLRDGDEVAFFSVFSGG
jgi:molybdopterin synthase sulfur carrier subunit